jgi:hypothetical protein
MTERERRDKELVLRLAFQQLHLTVIEEESMFRRVSMNQLYNLRDDILDKIIRLQKELGLRK